MTFYLKIESNRDANTPTIGLVCAPRIDSNQTCTSALSLCVVCFKRECKEGSSVERKIEKKNYCEIHIKALSPKVEKKYEISGYNFIFPIFFICFSLLFDVKST